jgi:hypothetical protein
MRQRRWRGIGEYLDNLSHFLGGAWDGLALVGLCLFLYGWGRLLLRIMP